MLTLMELSTIAQYLNQLLHSSMSKVDAQLLWELNDAIVQDLYKRKADADKLQEEYEHKKDEESQREYMQKVEALNNESSNITLEYVSDVLLDVSITTPMLHGYITSLELSK